MLYLASIHVMPHKELLDPQGKTVLKNMKNIDVHSVKDVRIGKRIEMKLEAENEEEASELVNKACKKLLVNVIMESYEFSLTNLN